MVQGNFAIVCSKQSVHFNGIKQKKKFLSAGHTRMPNFQV